jgi:hypothetical protein
MGQARARGTYEERKAAAIKRNEESRERELERERNITPEEKKARENAQKFLCSIAGIFPYRPINRRKP